MPEPAWVCPGFTHAGVRVLPPPLLAHLPVLCLQAIESGVGDDVDGALLVDREGVPDLLAQVLRVDHPRARRDPPDHSVHRDEPDPPLPVGQRRDHPVVRGNDPVQVIVLDHLEVRLLGLGDHQDVPLGRRHDGPVLIVEIEIPAAREVRERIPSGVELAWRQLVRRQRHEGVRIEQGEDRPLEPDADRHEPALGVERDRRALVQEVARVGGRFAKRALDRVRVRLISVDVDVRLAVRRHERMLGRRGKLERVCLGRLPGEHGQVAAVGLRDRPWVDAGEKDLGARSFSAATRRERGDHTQRDPRSSPSGPAEHALARLPLPPRAGAG